jgi:hypothetical protein
LYEGFDEGAWSNSWRMVASYDAGGHLLSRTYEVWQNTDWMKLERVCYDYDAHGNLICGSWDRWQDSLWVPMDGYFDFADSAGSSYSFVGQRVYLFYRIATSVEALPGDRNPLTYDLFQNYPNPFNGETTIGYRIREIGDGVGVTLRVYDILGREVATLVNEKKDPGTYTVRWDASGMASGLYFCQLTANASVQTRKLVLAR